MRNNKTRTFFSFSTPPTPDKKIPRATAETEVKKHTYRNAVRAVSVIASVRTPHLSYIYLLWGKYANALFLGAFPFGRKGGGT